MLAAAKEKSFEGMRGTLPDSWLLLTSMPDRLAGRSGTAPVKELKDRSARSRSCGRGDGRAGAGQRRVGDN